MYPGISVPSVESSANFLELTHRDTVSVLDSLQDIINRGVVSQIVFLNKFAMNLFKDIMSDLSLVKTRAENLNAKIQQVKARASKTYEFLASKPLSYFENTKSVDLKIERVSYDKSKQPGQTYTNLAQMMKVPEDNLTFKEFVGVGRITDPIEIKKRMSDPSILHNQYVEELLNELKEMEEPQPEHKPSKPPAAAHQSFITQQESDAIINAFSGRIRPADKFLVNPPPKGTTDWRHYVAKLPTRYEAKMIDEEVHEVTQVHEIKPHAPKKPRPAYIPKPKPIAAPKLQPQRPPEPKAPTKKFINISSATNVINATSQPQEPAPSKHESKKASKSSSSSSSAAAPPPPPPPAANLPPPPPPPANLPPPPPPSAPKAPSAPSAPKASNPAPDNPGDFLSLIKQGNFSLKKVDQDEEKEKKHTITDPNNANVAELLLMEMQRRREDIVETDSDEDDDQSDSESDW
ncbi:hypothetical protein TVAG_182600 [Trichomonas vaginalis G3]|uniref:WH2 motif family protein n=1 Tax=Trichomonas vaginalis (strain ATCC PRA-98 / G3) TaxID=412133 RepID=A2D8Z8_TRIV3|nr:proline-rich extensin signature family [Trichomonas vaginalis G3]EAY23024.1 hypothetical protein TVAG_182600 [Trichomonas vaginalis G3]KAI5518987.1 proline-rich extensin signature family [Trichomonas vaginalis G3]|eukprot:XP_001584010.1 hypothetical protein [Trichomonas vaginalis G3]